MNTFLSRYPLIRRPVEPRAEQAPPLRKLIAADIRRTHRELVDQAGPVSPEQRDALLLRAVGIVEGSRHALAPRERRGAA